MTQTDQLKCLKMKPEIYILKNDVLEVHISNWGATITRMLTGGIDGRMVDVVLGMEQAEDYQGQEYVACGAYLGAMIGRYGNRIANGKFHLDGKEIQLAVNNGANHLHGGICGFDKRSWALVTKDETTLSLRYISPDREEHYPGTLKVEVCFKLVENELKIVYEAETDQKCYVNLTHHPYFNLCPATPDVKEHTLKLYTDKYLKTINLIPDGSMLTAEGNYDFTKPVSLHRIIDRGGLDDCFVFENQGMLMRLAELSSIESGIKLYVSSDYPGLQVYTGRYLDVKNAKGGKHYGAYAGIALEPQYLPDSPNHPSFPSTLLVPGEKYRKTIIYGFEQ